MATAVSHPMTLTPFANSNQCEPDVEEWFNFSDLQSPTPATNAPSSSQMPASSAPSALTSPATTIAPLDGSDDFQKPSFDYAGFKQQTGVPSGSIPGLHTNFQGFSNSASGIDDMSLMNGWGSGIGMDSDFNMDTEVAHGLPAYFFPSESSQQDDFIDPSNISQLEEPANVRVWPGMHQQQALAKAQQAQEEQQKRAIAQQQQQQQQQQRQQARSNGSRRTASHQPTDARTEETIARVVNQIRQNSQLASQEDMSGQNLLPHIVRMRKDEEDMDEDERLLASDEGKKLSSKERRQLRNKVSARAFRSRRKEYIGQLEGEVAVKSNECNELRTQNRALMEENARSRAFIEKLLRHRAFAPFLEDLSREESVQAAGPSQQQHTSTNPSPQPTFKDVNPYQRPQQVQDITQPQNPQIGMALVPETPLDISMLSLQSNWGSQNMGLSYQHPQVFAVMDVPAGPVNPINTEALSGKGYEAFDEPESVDEVKPDFPVVQAPSSFKSVKASKPAETEEDREFDNDPAFTLYHASESSSSATPSNIDELPSFSNIMLPEKESHFEIVVVDSSSEHAMERVERICASMEPVYQRLLAFNSSN